MDLKSIIKSPKNNKQERIIFCLILQALGDLIAFNVKYGPIRELRHEVILTDDIDFDYVYELIFSFIEKGGITKLDISKNKVTDATIYNMATIKGLLDNYNFIKYYLDEHKKIEYYQITDRIFHNNVKNIKDVNTSDINNTSIACVKSIGIGLLYEDIDKIFKACYESTVKVTDNGTAIIGSFIAALFTSCAIKQKKCEEWLEILIEIFNSGILIKLLNEKYHLDLKKFINKVNLFKERIEGKKENISIKYPQVRGSYYYRNFAEKSNIIMFGNKCDDCILIAYDCLLDCHVNNEPSFEKLVYSAVINIGKNNMIGSLACAWYGALYGKTEDILDKWFINMDRLNDLFVLGEQINRKTNK